MYVCQSVSVYVCLQILRCAYCWLLLTRLHWFAVECGASRLVIQLFTRHLVTWAGLKEVSMCGSSRGDHMRLTTLKNPRTHCISLPPSLPPPSPLFPPYHHPSRPHPLPAGLAGIRMLRTEQVTLLVAVPHLLSPLTPNRLGNNGTTNNTAWRPRLALCARAFKAATTSLRASII